MLPPAAIKTQRERKGVGEVIGGGDGKKGKTGVSP
jgi:hypothetical protein